MKRMMLWLPLGAFALLFAVVASGLFRPSDHLVHSQMVGKPLPQFALPAMIRIVRCWRRHHVGSRVRSRSSQLS